MRMLHQRHINGLYYCSRNGNSAMKGQKHIGSAKVVYYYKQNMLSQCHGLIEIPTESITERKIFRTGTENKITLTYY